MIYDKIENLSKYNIANLDTIIEKINNFKELEVGKFKFLNGFILKQECETNNDSKFEAHKKFIDIQVLISGTEYLEIENISKLKQISQYDENLDIQFFNGKGNKLKVSAGEFYMLFPHEGHRACLHTQIPQNIKKLVFKIPV